MCRCMIKDTQQCTVCRCMIKGTQQCTVCRCMIKGTQQCTVCRSMIDMSLIQLLNVTSHYKKNLFLSKLMEKKREILKRILAVSSSSEGTKWKSQKRTKKKEKKKFWKEIILIGLTLGSTWGQSGVSTRRHGEQQTIDLKQLQWALNIIKL